MGNGKLYRASTFCMEIPTQAIAHGPKQSLLDDIELTDFTPTVFHM